MRLHYFRVFIPALCVFIILLLFYHEVLSKKLNTHPPLTQEQLVTLIHKLPTNPLQITANQQVLDALNEIISHHQKQHTYFVSIHRVLKEQNTLGTLLEKNSVPGDVLAIVVLESRGINKKPISYKGVNTAGLWQFTTGTAKNFGLVVKSTLDERMSPEKSTQAAADYLISLHKAVGNWSLTIMSYNAGLGSIQNLMKKNNTQDAWVIINNKSTPEQIRTYLPKFQATVILMHNPQLLE